MGKGDDTARPVRRGGSKVGTVHTYASQRRAPPELKYLFKRGKDTGGETRDARAERVRREREEARRERDEARARRRAEAEGRPRRPLREHPALKPAVIAAHVMKTRGVDADDALEVVRRAHPRADPNAGFVAQLRLWRSWTAS